MVLEVVAVDFVSVEIIMFTAVSAIFLSSRPPTPALRILTVFV